MMILWTGLKQLHSTSDDTIGPNEEEGHSLLKLALEKEKLNL